MASIVLELQQEAANSSTPMLDVLRKARVVATKLRIADMNAWIEHELYGYPASVPVPEYRILRGDVRALNPYNGYLMPVQFSTPAEQESLSTVQARQPIGALYEVVTGSDDWLQVRFSDRQLAAMHAADNDRWPDPFRYFSKPQVTAIFDAVRNRILDWSLRLEAEGILGEGMTFTTQERSKAATMTSINIGSVANFQGVIGTVADSTIQIDNVKAVDTELAKQGFSRDQRVEIQQIIAEYKAAPTTGKLPVAKRGIQWVVDNAEKLGALASLFRDFFGGHRG